jgi:hypothetical protein
MARVRGAHAICALRPLRMRYALPRSTCASLSLLPKYVGILHTLALCIALWTDGRYSTHGVSVRVLTGGRCKSRSNISPHSGSTGAVLYLELPVA